MGFNKTIIKEGIAGRQSIPGDNISVHATGYVIEGQGQTRKFWSTRDSNSPFSFTVGIAKVIKGWDQGMLDMSIGEICQLNISPDFGYGARGFPAWGIPPNATLLFEIELLSIN
eukprot:TRINITY_DN355_c0_g3_i1.p1 TRINITY_DN355_c0_g3~~TRINITY_DN355_c0_g3_i1.p1  ORF type:complete len:114 (-),score=35.46 TRINITY_DN355_c0_g3_i1:672-1013(-)